MPETGPRTPDPREQDQPRVTAPAVPAAEHPPATVRDGAGQDAATGDDPARDAAAGSAPALDIPTAGGPSHAGTASKRARRAKSRERHGPLFLWVKEVATVVLVAIVLSFLIKTFLFRAFYIPSESMVNTLDVNDRIFVNLLVPEPFALQHGDVVVFRDTQGWLVPAPEKASGPFTWVQDGPPGARPG